MAKRDKNVYDAVGELRGELEKISIRLRDLDKRLYIKQGKLTDRQEDVLRLMCQGLKNEEVATALSLELATVERHINRIIGSLNASGSRAAMAWGFKNLKGL